MSASDTSGGGAYSRQNVLSIYLPAVTLAIGTGVLIPAIPIYARSFNIPFEVASLVIIVQQLGSMCASLPTGLLADRFGRRRIVLAGPILLAISSFLAVTAQSFPELVAYRFIAGIGSQMWQIGRLTMIADTGGDHERGRQITTMHSMESTGRLLSPVLGGFLAALWDVRAPFVVHAILCIAAIAPSFKLVKETAPHLAQHPSGRRPPAEDAGDGGFRALLTYPVIVLFAAQFCAFLTRGPMYAGQINLYSAYAYDLDPQTLGILATAASAIGIPIGLGSGYVMDRFGRKAMNVPGFSILCLAMCLMGLTAFLQVPFPVFVVFYLLLNAATAATSGNMQTLGSDHAPPTARGRFYGVFQLLGSTGQPTGTSGFAALSATMGTWMGFLFLAAVSALTAFILGTQVHDRVRDDIKTAHAARSH